jgi:hypothetical protein
MRRSRAILIICSSAIGVVFGSTILYIAFQHNPQGEFFDPETGVVNWRYAAWLFVAWFVIASAFAAVLLTAARFLLSGLRRHWGKSGRSRE